MKQLSRILAILLSFSLLLAGCASPQPAGAASASPPAASASSQSVAVSAQTPAPTQPIALTAIGQFPADFNFEDPFLKTINEKVGVDVKWEMIPTTSFEERLTIIMASKTLPDILFFPTSKTFDDARRNGLLLDITKQIEGSKNIMEYTDPASIKATRDESGALYALPRNSVPRTDGMVVRKDWLDKVNITLPADGIVTLDEFTAICKAFTENDPDGNGKKDTYGLTQRSAKGVLQVPERIMAAFSTSSQFETAPAGSEYPYMNPMYSKTDPSYVEALKYTNMMWKSGYMDPNWPANDGNAYMDRFQMGIAGISPCFGGWMGDWKAKMLPNFPDVAFTYIYGIKNAQGDVKSRSVLGANCYGYWAASVSAKGKEDKIVQLFDYILSDEGWNYVYYGIEGHHYKQEGDKKVFTDAYTPFNATKSYMALVRRSNTPALWLNPALPQETLTEMDTVISKCIENVLPCLDLAYQPNAAKDPAYIDFVSSNVDTVRSKIITGDLPPEAWYTMLDEWYKVGGTQYIKEMNEYIAKTQD